MRWCEQQQIELRSDHDVLAVALHNDEQQFSVFLEPRIEQPSSSATKADNELFETYFASDEGRELIIPSLYGVIRGEAG